MVNINTLYIMCGLPFSGKAICAKKITEKYKLTYISQDDTLFSQGFSFENNRELTKYELKVLFETIYIRISESLKKGNSVMYDAANKSKVGRNKLRKLASKAGANFQIVYLDTPISLIYKRWKRNRKTNKRFDVTEYQLKKTLEKFESPDFESGLIKFKSNSDFEKYFFGKRED